ncbi:glycosyltransferase family 4 protein [Vagococcus martis]|uniref:glycosyltransferase family 4 protein n=1 Tax=Vagococcus martis TaxID=1768210 RepID=UPI0009A2683B|nr:glycosyltransferase family 4 protein [Vagococcus martis]
MKKIKFVSRRRGFFNHLENINDEIVFEFIQSSFEVPSIKRKIASQLIRTKFMTLLGVIETIKYNTNEDKETLLGSFNRFLSVERPYFIYLENPTALFHYTLGRNKSYLGKHKFKNNLENAYLKEIVCMSYACMSTMDDIFSPAIYRGKRRVIYPLVPDNNNVTVNLIKERCKDDELNVLFIAQGTRFISKGGLEVLEAFKYLKDVKITVITNISSVEGLIKEYRELPNIKFYDFKYSYEDMEQIYAQHQILLHPSSDDSFGLTVLEAMKAGLPIITTRLYAFPEMVEEGINGYMVQPKWEFFGKNNLPNPLVWNNRKKNSIFD